ncbi:hypothetical protein [Ideonella margarita]|uniref:Uncharacterized protein n=1 Tax=Ideonella margarita TaxID=2984191 RepID=A0ABU9C788_9BURK
MTRQHAPNEVALQAREQGGHEHDDGHANGHDANDEGRLDAALAQEAQRDDPFKRLPPGQHGQVGRGR